MMSKPRLNLGCGHDKRGEIRMDYKSSKMAINIIGDAHHLPFRDKSISKTLCNCVLEHVLSPFKALSEMKRVTDGSIIIVVPNLTHIRRIIKAIRNPFYDIDHETTHFQGWGPSEIRHLAYFVGLKVKSLRWGGYSKYGLGRLCGPLLYNHMIITLREASKTKWVKIT